MASASAMGKHSDSFLAKLTQRPFVGADARATLGWELLELAASSYEGKYTKYGVDKIAEHDNEVALGQAGPGAGILQISFRGTLGLEHLDQWLFESGNANASKVVIKKILPTLEGSVHSGFLSGYCGLRSQLFKWVAEQLQAINGNAVVIRVTGHSRGAAFASLAAPDLASHFPQCSLQLVLWAAPRVGDHVYCDFCNKLPNLSIAAFANKRDPVVHLPPETVKDLHPLIQAGLPRAAENIIQGFKHLVEPVELDAAFAGPFEWLTHGIDVYKENYRLFFKDVRVACREKRWRLCKDRFNRVLKRMLLTGSTTGVALQACVSELEAQNHATHRLVKESGRAIQGSLEELKKVVTSESHKAELRHLAGAVDALVTSMMAGGSSSLPVAVHAVKASAFTVAQLANEDYEDTDFDGLFESLTGAFGLVFSAAMLFSQEPVSSALREAAGIKTKLGPCITRFMKKVTSVEDMNRRAPSFHQLVKRWDLASQHEDCPDEVKAQLADDAVGRLSAIDTQFAMPGWKERASALADNAQKLVTHLQALKDIAAFEDLRPLLEKHLEHMEAAEKPRGAAHPALAVGGRVNAGKTTFVNAMLRRWANAPINLLPTKNLENSACMVELHLTESGGPNDVIAELCRKEWSTEDMEFVDAPKSGKQTFSNWKELQEAVKQTVQGHPRKEGERDESVSIKLFKANKSVLICDTPGMDGRTNIRALKNYAKVHVFMYVHLVPLDEPSIGNQALEFLSQLHEQSCLPTLLVFTKLQERIYREQHLINRALQRNDDDESAKATAMTDVGELFQTLSSDLPHNNHGGTLPVFAAVSQVPDLEKQGDVGAQQFDQVLRFLDSTLLDYNELRAADARVTLVAEKTRAIVNILLQTERGVFSSQELDSCKEEMVRRMTSMVDDYFEDFPQNREQLSTYPTEERSKRLWSKATRSLLSTPCTISRQVPQRWFGSNVGQEVQEIILKEWSEAFVKELHPIGQEVARVSVPTGHCFGSFLDSFVATLCGCYCAVAYTVAAVVHLPRPLNLVAAFASWTIPLALGRHGREKVADEALTVALKNLNAQLEKIKTSTKKDLEKWVDKLTGEMASFRNAETSTLGRMHHLDQYQVVPRRVRDSSGALQAEMREAFSQMPRWVGGDQRLESIVLQHFST